MARSTAIVAPDLGLYFDRSPIAMDRRMLQDGNNFRVKEGELSNLNVGWKRLEPSITLDGPVMLIDRFVMRNNIVRMIIATTKSIYKYDPVAHTVVFITPSWTQGNASASGTAVTGSGTPDWDGAAGGGLIAPGDQISFGSATQNSPSATWFTIASINSATSITLTTSAGSVASGPYTIRRLLSGNLSNVWMTDVFQNAGVAGDDQWWATNGVDELFLWNGVTTFAQNKSADFGFKCKALRVYNNMMIFANITQAGVHRPRDIINSDVGDPGNVTTGLSEQFTVHAGPDEILEMNVIGDALAIYSRRNITLAQFVGDPFIFVFRNAASGVGTLAPKAVADFGDYHEFIGQDSQYRFDGATVREIGQHVWREVLRTQDPARVIQAYHIFDEANADLIWSVPLTTDPGTAAEVAYVEHYLEAVAEAQPHPVSKRRFPFTAVGQLLRGGGMTWDQVVGSWESQGFRWDDQFFSSSFPIPIAGDFNGKLYEISQGVNADGAFLESFVLFGRWAMVDGRQRGLLRRVYPFVAPFANPVSVDVRVMDHAMGAVTGQSSFSFDQTLPEGQHFVSPFRRGRYLEIGFSTEAVNEAWKLSGLDVEIVSGGSR